MHVSKRTGVALLAVAALAGSATTAINALGSSARPVNIVIAHQVLSTTLVPSVPSDAAIHGVVPGGAPWALTFGAAQLLSDGALTVEIKGLLITGTGTANDGTVGPVQKVDAALYCGADTTAAATSPSVTLSANGDALIVARLKLPATCLAPQLLINPTVGGNAIASVYIAASGF